MAEKNNATCAICGKGYYMCASCKDKMSATPWKIHTDTSEHYKVFQIIKGHSLGVYDDNEANIKLQNIDLSDIEEFKPEIKNIIKNIIGNNEMYKSRNFRRKKEIEVADKKEDFNVNIETSVDVEIKSQEVKSDVESE